VPVRVAMEDGCPIRVATDRRGCGEGRVLASSGPWRSSGNWWSACGHGERGGEASASVRSEGGAPLPVKNASACPIHQTQFWDHEEWDVSLADGGIYRIFLDGATGRWFLEAIVD
jgi:hypothetical protein